MSTAAKDVGQAAVERSLCPYGHSAAAHMDHLKPSEVFPLNLLVSEEGFHAAQEVQSRLRKEAAFFHSGKVEINPSGPFTRNSNSSNYHKSDALSSLQP